MMRAPGEMNANPNGSSTPGALQRSQLSAPSRILSTLGFLAAPGGLLVFSSTCSTSYALDVSVDSTKISTLTAPTAGGVHQAQAAESPRTSSAFSGRGRVKMDADAVVLTEGEGLEEDSDQGEEQQVDDHRSSSTSRAKSSSSANFPTSALVENKNIKQEQHKRRGNTKIVDDAEGGENEPEIMRTLSAKKTQQVVSSSTSTRQNSTSTMAQQQHYNASVLSFTSDGSSGESQTLKPSTSSGVTSDHATTGKNANSAAMSLMNFSASAFPTVVPSKTAKSNTGNDNYHHDAAGGRGRETSQLPVLVNSQEMRKMPTSKTKNATAKTRIKDDIASAVERMKIASRKISARGAPAAATRNNATSGLHLLRKEHESGRPVSSWSEQLLQKRSPAAYTNGWTGVKDCRDTNRTEYLTDPNYCGRKIEGIYGSSAKEAACTDYEVGGHVCIFHYVPLYQFCGLSAVDESGSSIVNTCMEKCNTFFTHCFAQNSSGDDLFGLAYPACASSDQACKDAEVDWFQNCGPAGSVQNLLLPIFVELSANMCDHEFASEMTKIQDAKNLIAKIQDAKNLIADQHHAWFTGTWPSCNEGCATAETDDGCRAKCIENCGVCTDTSSLDEKHNAEAFSPFREDTTPEACTFLSQLCWCKAVEYMKMENCNPMDTPVGILQTFIDAGLLSEESYEENKAEYKKECAAVGKSGLQLMNPEDPTCPTTTTTAAPAPAAASKETATGEDDETGAGLSTVALIVGGVLGLVGVGIGGVLFMQGRAGGAVAAGGGEGDPEFFNGGGNEEYENLNVY
ncbi:unnamed protein product [Amoebophrya sp. A120]|nr:unnamed protein product [Amoebophrya sp. A120]|eukprot:GSA120T00012830001.1